MPRSETIALVEHMSRPSFWENRQRKLFPAIAAAKADPRLEEERDERAQGRRST